MFWEYSYRQKKEVKLAEQENRKRRNIQFPKPPTWNRKTDTVEYEGYSNEVLRKVKQDL
jgi:hypothetical protein